METCLVFCATAVFRHAMPSRRSRTRRSLAHNMVSRLVVHSIAIAHSSSLLSSNAGGMNQVSTSDVASGLTGSVTLPPLAPGFPVQTLRNITPAQASYINSLLALGGPAAQLGIGYAYLASGGGSTALTGFNPLIATSAPFTPGTVIGSRFFLTGTPIPLSTTNSLGQPIAFRALNNLQKI